MGFWFQPVDACRWLALFGGLWGAIFACMAVITIAAQALARRTQTGARSSVSWPFAQRYSPEQRVRHHRRAIRRCA